MANAEEARQDPQKESKKSKGTPDKKQAAAESNSFQLGELYQGTKEELSKVVWPSRQQLINESLAVVLMVGVSATLIYFVDNLLRWVAAKVFVA